MNTRRDLIEFMQTIKDDSNQKLNIRKKISISITL